MRKILTIFLLFLSFIFASAQMDTEHWFAPVYNSIGSMNEFEAYLYVSTDQTRPFNVKVYNNNVLQTTLSISKGSPGIYKINNQDFVTDSPSDILKPITKGLSVIGDNRFFANVRFQIPFQAEIITSKGKAALGNNFYITNSPLPRSESYFNFSVGIIATENNTNVKISKINPTVKFFDSTSASQLNVTLNKGESYLIAGTGNDSNNLDGLTGAKIESDKAIAVVNGNMGASISTNRNDSKDIYMDETVPVERLGDSFALIKGEGPIGKNMEIPMIVATENSTQVFVNNDTTPYVFTMRNGTQKNTLDEGEYGLIDENNYINQGNGVYNIFIKTTKNAYVYQNLAGTANGSYYATGGFNYIPPLNCFLPNKIDEIGNINKIGSSAYDTKLNILTQKGAVVKLNGSVLSGTNGPYPLLGNNDWETYVVNNVTGNISVVSDKSTTAGIAAGSGAVGYGGYFAGFNSVPLISKGGSCDSSSTLEVDNTYNSYQWYLNGVAISGATSYIITPTQSGYYTCEIIKDNCGNAITPTFTYQRCPFKSSNNYEIGDCNTTLTIPAPEFTVSTQTENYSTLTETVSPQNGRINIDRTTGIITYTLTNFAANTDTFTVSLSGNDPTFPDTEFFTYNIDIKHLKTINTTVNACKEANAKGKFNLKSAIVYNDINYTPNEFYTNYNPTTKTFSGLILGDLTQYESIEKTIYTKVTNSYGCVEMAEIKLEFFPIPNLNTINYNPALCDIDFDGLYEVDFEKEVTPIVVSSYQNFNVYYSLTNDFSSTGRLPNNWSYTNPTRVNILVASKNGCTDATGFIDFNIGNKLTVNNITVPICDNDRDGKETVKISDYVPINYLYFSSRSEAENPLGTITSNEHEISTNTIYYIRTVDATFCPNIFELQFTFNQPNVSTKLKDKIFCKEQLTTGVDAGSGFTYYKWSNGTEGINLQTANYGAGTHFVELSSNGCVYKQYFTVTEAQEPIINSIIEEDNTITVNVSGGNPPYQYSLDQINWQPSNVFTNLNRGSQKVYVRDTYQCTPIEKEFLILNLINAITPNGDGINDVLDYSDLRVKKDVKILVYDRYGSQIFTSQNKNSFVWNGINSFNRPVSTGTYWYVLEWIEPDTGIKMTFKGWILVKERN